MIVCVKFTWKGCLCGEHKNCILFASLAVYNGKIKGVCGFRGYVLIQNYYFLFCGFRQSGKHYRNIHTNVSSRVPTTRVKVLGITISAFLTWVKNLLTSFFVYFYFYCRKKCDALNYILDSLMCDKYISYAT
jgi:hypothetical protein